ncbi:hypothetical protein [Providencia sneebia]|uniref:Lipoprotein n=1 Tax=Providencia sneebia DSM 19967 TaxID=1141660 RepID=K8WQS0_9GAMM|nr:hypothetical protein [Providencia sneebia]EKT58490.1 hypothetical protein OO7_07219 [Providencia sneebia DSM 19967]
MRYLLCFFLVTMISGCSNYGVNTEHLDLLNNNELCKALGENQAFELQGFDRKSEINRISDEVNLRAAEGTLDKFSCKNISEDTKDYETSRERFKTLNMPYEFKGINIPDNFNH